MKTLLVLLFSFAALADPVIIGAPPVAPSGIGGVLLGLLTPGNLGVALATVFGAIGGFQFFTAKRKRLVALASYYAFHVVEDVTNELDDGPAKQAFDKTSAFLKVVDQYMLANGWRPLKPGEQEVAKIAASALHGVEVAKEKVAVAAAAVAADVSAPAPTPR